MNWNQIITLSKMGWEFSDELHATKGANSVCLYEHWQKFGLYVGKKAYLFNTFEKLLEFLQGEKG